jgi:putative oxidoreductase
LWQQNIKAMQKGNDPKTGLSVKQHNALSIIRMVTGLLVSYHGFEIFDKSIVDGYTTWDTIKQLPFPIHAVYLGKSIELLSGLLLTMGLFTRIAGVLLMAVMLFICFYVGGGKFWYEDQHPFLFALLGAVFLATGGGKYSVDQLRFRKNKKPLI